MIAEGAVARRPRLPARLATLASLLPAGSVADLGAGHGMLAAHLALAGRRVVATEAAAGPLRELRDNLARWGADVEVRAGRGLEPLLPGEVEGVVVAGLGADVLCAIAAEAGAGGVRWVALQCVQRPWRLAAWVERAEAVGEWHVLARAEPAERGRRYPTWVLGAGEA